MAEHMLASALEWLEHKTKPIFVIAAFIAYAVEIYALTQRMSPLDNLNAFLIGALGALATPFSIILLQEMLELVAKISESNLLSARHQFEIVLLVIVRSFFKSFSKVNGYVEEGAFSSTVQESVVKVFAIIILMVMIQFFRVMADSDYLYWYSEQGERSNIYKQALVVVLIVAAIIYQISGPVQPATYAAAPDAKIAQAESKEAESSLSSDKSDTDDHGAAYEDEKEAAVADKSTVDNSNQTEVFAQYFDVFAFVSLVFTGLIVIEALFLILSILKGNFPQLMLESSLVIALIFARFPLFVSNSLSYALSVLGVAFATGALYLFYRASKWMQETGQSPTRQQAQNS